MPLQRRKRATIGELYDSIKINERDFEKGQGKLVKKQHHPFVRLCKKLAGFMPGAGKGAVFNEENKKAVDFLRWDLSPEEFAAASSTVLIGSVFFAFIVGTIFMFTPLSEIFLALQLTGFAIPVMAFMPWLLLAVGVVSYFQSYPATEAQKEKTRALTYVPEIMGYMIMSIKLVPNLEKAVEFAAEHGRGKIADDFRTLMWEVQIGVHNSLSEGLDKLAYRWGEYSDEFKRGLMRVRDSVIESSESRRYSLLDKTMEEILENIRMKMEDYVRGLSQPTTMLFYVGILLPLLLIIILPVGSSFSGTPLANPIVLFLIYNIIIPLIMVVFAYSILQSKPPTYRVPIIPDNHPDLPPKGQAIINGIKIDVKLAAILVLIFGVAISITISAQGFPPQGIYDALGLEKIPQILGPDKQKDFVLGSAGKNVTYFDVPEKYGEEGGGELYVEYMNQSLRFTNPDDLSEEDMAINFKNVKTKILSEQKIFFSKSQNDIAPYNLVFGLLMTFSFAMYIYFYYNNIYKRKLQLEVQEIESDFQDSIYIIASRMGENKPVEEALKSVREFLKNSKATKIFDKTLDNINLLGMPLSQAIFDKNYGSIANIPSVIIRGAMKILVDSVALGVNVAAKTLISLSIQLQNSEKVNKMLQALISDITSTMKTMTLFIAPLVLGITTSLQRIVIVTMSSIASSDLLSSNQGFDMGTYGDSFSGMNISNIVSSDSIASIASPTEFILLVALYIIELVIIMTYFTTKIEEDNDLLVKINIAKFLPIAVAMFVISILISNSFVGAAI